jgi:hypothetical protein
MKINEKGLYSEAVYQECLKRIEQLTAETRPQWGRMTAAQMLSHSSEILEVSNGKELKNTPFLAKLFKGMIRTMVVNQKPYPKNTKTHPQYRKVSDYDFGMEKKRLLTALDTFSKKEKSAGRPKHPLFGEMTSEERSWGMYKHLDHHLTQFGV